MYDSAGRENELPDLPWIAKGWTNWGVGNEKLGEPVENDYCYGDGKGGYLIGWNKIGGDWYNFSEEDATVLKGWQKHGEDWYYYMKNNAAVLKDGWVGDYYCGADGKWIPNKLPGEWINNNGKYSFEYQKDGNSRLLKNEWKMLLNKWYFFDENTYRVTGLQKVQGTRWFYFDDDGVMQKGWKNIKGKWYYFAIDNKMVKLKKANTYYFSEGEMVYGWHNIDFNGKKQWFYFSRQEDGKAPMLVGRQYINDTNAKVKEAGYYYFAENNTDYKGYCTGAMVSNITINGRVYDKNGKEASPGGLGSQDTNQIHSIGTSIPQDEDVSKIPDDKVQKMNSEDELGPQIESKQELSKESLLGPQTEDNIERIAKDEQETQSEFAQEKPIESQNIDKPKEDSQGSQQNNSKETQQEKQSKDGSAKVQFEDVKSDDWYYNAVQFVVDKKLFNGVSDTEFSPNAKMTRGMLVTILYRYSKSKEKDFATFDDVPQDQYYSIPIAWASKNKIVNGVGDNLFAPDSTITRQDVATILARFIKNHGLSIKKTKSSMIEYVDSMDISDYARESVQLLGELGLMTGKDDNNFDPNGLTTRAEVAIILMRLVQNV